MKGRPPRGRPFCVKCAMARFTDSPRYPQVQGQSMGPVSRVATILSKYFWTGFAGFAYFERLDPAFAANPTEVAGFFLHALTLASLFYF